MILASTVHARKKKEERGRRKGETKRKRGKGGKGEKRGRDERRDRGKGVGWIFIAIPSSPLPHVRTRNERFQLKRHEAHRELSSPCKCAVKVNEMTRTDLKKS